ncbi:hypothetical protein PR202_ga14607 [Eleusine coracana subsp. coracana]|uniref:Uncharacterized protein n=1 Tax=Eleusine coracana subsp. coracana TaxID=191504 RepID=A0AAV5CHN6_ELECO|nr:hypothetical protein PR202_ga14607 [Eleusine coracana subsp. coracana]
MVTTMKGIFKGLKTIAKIFTVRKEHKIEIGYPTDMNEFRRLEEASAGSVGSMTRLRQTSWPSIGNLTGTAGFFLQPLTCFFLCVAADFEQPIGGVLLMPAEVYIDGTTGHDSDCTGNLSGRRKTRRTTKARESSSSSSARSSSLRSTASFATACDDFGEQQSALRAVA